MIQSRMLARLLVAVGAMIAALAAFTPVAGAEDEPATGFTQFKGCPSQNENSAVRACLRAVVNGGHFQMGSKDVPIQKPITLVGGYSEDTTQFLYTAKGGLVPAKQEVPGGVIGLTGLDWLVKFLNVDALKLYAVTELAGTPGPPLPELISLPIKVHLINPVLGNNCYVGSNANPIQLNLIPDTTEPPPPNEPITGVSPEVSFDELGIIHIDGGVYVDNSFAAPGASGCVLTLFPFLPISLDSIVNSQAGLPSPAGTNETVQELDAELANVELVHPPS